MEAALLQLPSLVTLSPDGRAALERFCEALKRHGHLDTFSSLLEWWASLRVDVPDGKRAVAALYAKLAERAPRPTSLMLHRQALELWPGCDEAIAALEGFSEELEPSELIDRYTSFLEHAPFSAQAATIRQRLIDLLVELGEYEAALVEVRHLPKRSSEPCPSAIVRACSIAPLAPAAQDDEPEAHAQAISREQPLAHEEPRIRQRTFAQRAFELPDFSIDSLGDDDETPPFGLDLALELAMGIEGDDDAGATLILDERDIEILGFDQGAQA